MEDAFAKTTTVLTIDLPVRLGDRLRQVLYTQPNRTVRDVTLEALELWLDRHEQLAESSREVVEREAQVEPVE